jgi:hypothetical protein
MKTELTEEEMRRALFGEPEPEPEPQVSAAIELAQAPAPQIPVQPKAPPKKAKKVSKGFTPRLRVTLRVGNEFEGAMHEIVHEADTLSSLVAEQEATKAARKKFRFIEVVSVKSM